VWPDMIETLLIICKSTRGQTNKHLKTYSVGSTLYLNNSFACAETVLEPITGGVFARVCGYTYLWHLYGRNNKLSL
jgi:hypothetical protein